MKITIDTVADSKDDIRQAIVLMQSIIGDAPATTTEMTPSSDFTPMPTATDVLSAVENEPVSQSADEEHKEEEENLGFMTY